MKKNSLRGFCWPPITTHTQCISIYIYPHVFRWFLLELFASPMLELFEGIYQRTGQNIDHVL